MTLFSKDKKLSEFVDQEFQEYSFKQLNEMYPQFDIKKLILVTSLCLVIILVAAYIL